MPPSSDDFRHAIRMLFAYYLYRYQEKQQWERNESQADDYYKADYLIDLVEYFGRNGIIIPINENDKDFQKTMEMVYHIFDRAFFHKEAHPGCSDLECFTEAERYYCKEKALDYLSYFEYLNRNNNGLSGDQYSDYITAKKKYEEWRNVLGEYKYGCASTY